MDIRLEQDYAIDNMSDSLWQALQSAAESDNIGNAKAIHDEWIVDGQDPEDGGYEFIFLPNFTLEVWWQNKLDCYSLCNN